jgi:hypothetical protein
MPYSKTPIPNSANFGGGLLINNSAQVVWQGDVPIQIYLYRNQTGVTQKISDNELDKRTGFECDINENGIVVWDAYTTSGYAIFRYNGTASNINAGGQGSNSPDINDNDTIAFERYIWWQLITFECQLVLYSNGSFTRLIAWPGNNYAIYPKINNNGRTAYTLYDGSAKTFEVHLITGGTDKIIGGPYPSVQCLRINNNGWVVWSVEEVIEPHLNNIYLYDGTETRKICPDYLAYCSSPEINDRGQIVYESGTCDKMDVYLYSQGITQTLSPNVKYCWAPQINNYGEIVWWGGSEWPSSFPTEGTPSIYHSSNGSTAQEIATGGAYPQINDLGQIVYWDTNAHQLILLTPFHFIFRRILYLVTQWFRLIWKR